VLGLPTVSNHGNSIFFNGVDNQTYAVDAHSGLLIWSYPVSGSLSSAAIGPNCTLFLGSFDGKVFAIDAHTGFVLWQYVGMHHRRVCCRPK
jgi:eukaryotic-like serine/threonine-protein kinase